MAGVPFGAPAIFEGLSAQKLEFIANAPDGFKHPFIGNALKLFAQTLNVNVNGSGVTEVVESPNLIKKLVASENSVAVGCKEVEELA